MAKHRFQHVGFDSQLNGDPETMITVLRDEGMSQAHPGVILGVIPERCWSVTCCPAGLPELIDKVKREAAASRAESEHWRKE